MKNSAAFFSERYGYQAKEYLYAINNFGFFSPGLLFEVLSWIKTQYGGLSCIAMSANCKKYIDDYLLPLKGIVKEPFEVANIAEDTGRNNELRRLREKQLAEGIPKKDCAHPFDYRDYQEEALRQLFTVGFGRGLIEIPTAGGKSLVIANFVWNMWKHIDRNAKTLILVPNT